MRVFITGSTGFIGRALVLRLRREGHEVHAWVRSPARARNLLGADVHLVDAAGGRVALQRAIDGCDAVVNLAGEPLFGKRWTAARRRALVNSRVDLTRDIASAIRTARQPPAALIQASAVGYYGDRGDEWLDEHSIGAGDFAADLCARWERAAMAAAGRRVRVCAVRIGIVLGLDGGALAKMLVPFRLGLGGRLGDGRQYTSWIHIDDLVELFVRALDDERLAGIVNGVAPHPVTNRALTAALGRELRRPTWLPVPAFALRLAVGRAARLMLASQRVAPRVLERLGFAFRFPTIEDALRDIVGPHDGVSIRRSGKRYVLDTTTILDAPVERVFDYFSDPANLGALTPSSLSLSLASNRPVQMKEGTRIDHTIKIGPVRVRWRSRIAALRPGRSFVDIQERGPYRDWWHRHAFRALGNRTLMTDRVFYTPPLGWVGRVVHRLIIARTLRQIFRYRSVAIARRFGSSEYVVAPTNTAATS